MIILVWRLVGVEVEKVYLSLGSNMGDSAENLTTAIILIEADSKITLIKTSSYYKTKPVGGVVQDDFINCVIEIETTLNPIELLKVCQSVERQLKRERIVRWGPRTIDVDILLYGDMSINSDCLIIPHPRMYERAFVMVPLVEINSSFDRCLDNLNGQDIHKLLS